MIRLKTLLEQTTKKVPNVLFVTDNIEDRRKGFAKQLISNAIVTGDIRTVDKGSLAQLKDTLSVAISSYYDLVVVMTRGIYETNKNTEYSLTILNAIKNICKTSNIPLVLNTIPSVQFIKSKFDKDINFTLANDAEFDRFINQTADYVLDTGIFNDDSFFNKTGIYLTRQSHEILYSQMINIINDLDDTDETVYDVGQTEKIIAEPGSKGRHVRALQRRLIEFGYEISERELKNQKFGESTAAALSLFKMKHGLSADAVLDKQTINKLKTAVPDKFDINQTSDKDVNPTQGLQLITPIGIVSGNFSADLVTQAFDLILKYEGFNATAVWDVNNWRIGYGSSTVTKADGSVYRLSNNRSEKPIITITREDADRDLYRRISDEFIPSVKKDLGSDAYNAWEPGTIAALTSICYNYGSLPTSIIDAANTKTTSTLVDAVRALGTHNGGINKDRRNKEADYIVAAENYIAGVSDVTDFAGNAASTGWNSLTNILSATGAAIVGASMFDSSGGGKILGNNINIKVPGAGAHAGQSGWQSNNAWDIGAPVGTPVYAVNSGTVITFNDYGPTIQKRNGKKLFGLGFTVKSDNSLPSVYYTHLKNPQVSKGSKIVRGQLLAYVMDFPGSSFDHLHIGIESGDISQFITRDGTIKHA